MGDAGSDAAVVRVTLDLPMNAAAAFEALFDELVSALAGAGIEMEPREGGTIDAGARGAGTIVTWRPGTHAVLRWRQADWAPGQPADVDVRVDPVEGGCHIVLEHRGWAGALSDPADVVGWFAGVVAGPLVRGTSPGALGRCPRTRGLLTLPH
jgi:hypothetical protein